MAETRYADRFRRIVARLRARGFTVIEEPGCYSRTVGGPAGRPGAKDMLGLYGQTVHHTAGGSNSSDRRVVRDGREGLRGPLSQFLTETTGVGRLIASGYANHAGPSVHRRMGNSYSVGNEIVSRGRGTADFTPEQMAFSRALAEEVAREGAFAHDWVRGHKEEGTPIGRKVDPAFSMTSFRASLGAGAPTPTPAPSEEDFMAPVTEGQWNDVASDVEKTKAAVGEIAGIAGQLLDLNKAIRARQEVGLADQRAQSIALTATRAAQTDVVTASRESAAAVIADIRALPPEVARSLRRELSRALAVDEKENA